MAIAAVEELTDAEVKAKAKGLIPKLVGVTQKFADDADQYGVFITESGESLEWEFRDAFCPDRDSCPRDLCAIAKKFPKNGTGRPCDQVIRAAKTAKNTKGIKDLLTSMTKAKGSK